MKSENGQTHPLMEVLDEEIKGVVQKAKFKDRTLNPAQYEISEAVYETLSGLVGGEARIDLHPAFSAEGVSIVTGSVSLNEGEVSILRTALAECNTLSIEPLTNGDVEIGVTVPGVFDCQVHLHDTASQLERQTGGQICGIAEIGG